MLEQPGAAHALLEEEVAVPPERRVEAHAWLGVAAAQAVEAVLLAVKLA